MKSCWANYPLRSDTAFKIRVVSFRFKLISAVFIVIIGDVDSKVKRVVSYELLPSSIRLYVMEQGDWSLRKPSGISRAPVPM